MQSIDDVTVAYCETTHELIAPDGGKLVNLIVRGEEHRDLLKYAYKLPSLQLSPRSLCDVELLTVGAFSPLDRFMGEAGNENTHGGNGQSPSPQRKSESVNPFPD